MPGADGAPPGKTAKVHIALVENSRVRRRKDEVITEEPLEIRLQLAGEAESTALMVTMRTPGNDFELTAGLLVSEGVVRRRAQIARQYFCTRDGEAQRYNAVNVMLAAGVAANVARLRRQVLTASSCGVCGAASLAAIENICPALPRGDIVLPPEYFYRLPAVFGSSQTLFSRTGGLHAAALFAPDGRLLLLREDVGRHNALDKLIGALLLQKSLPADNRVLLVSGRISFDLVQKALMAGIPLLAAVGAPSSLAIALAREHDMTLIGFLRERRFNVYSGEARLAVPPAPGKVTAGH